ncbi:MAG TPA: ester cyclase [Puia sp.]|nr:ester cyclase [Puia sp.]
MESQLEKNKAIVRRFNKKFIEEGNLDSFKDLIDDEFINHTAMAGVDPGPEGMITVINNMLRTAFPDLTVTIYEQVAEGDLVTTRKAISGTHTGPFMGVPATGRPVTINVMDMVRIKNGKYYEHWGINTMQVVLAQLSAGMK